MNGVCFSLGIQPWEEKYKEMAQAMISFIYKKAMFLTIEE